MTKKENKQKKDVVTEVATAVATLEEATEKKRENRYVEVIDSQTIKIQQREYRLVANYREAFDAEQLDERYSEILNRYDFIVGDIGFEQLRLRGFHGNNRKKTPLEQRIGALQDYLYEYCNFGCGYFVLERVRNEQPTNKQVAHTKEKKAPLSKNRNKPSKKQPVIRNRKRTTSKQGKKSKQQQRQTTQRGFTIRQTDEE